MSTKYDMRSNIKDKPGSQGTLFQVKDKSLLNTGRWPRGYTPERQREVDQALPKVVGLQNPPRDSFNDQTGEFDFDYPHARSVVREALSRSSVPVSDIQGLSRVGANAPQGRLGEYSPRFKRIDLDYKQPRNTVDQVVVHELGHHVDNKAGNSESFFSSYGPSPEDVGRGEAVADNYMEKHFQAHPRHAKEPLYDYRARIPEESLRSNYPGYLENRNANPLSASQFTHETLF